MIHQPLYSVGERAYIKIYVAPELGIGQKMIDELSYATPDIITVGCSILEVLEDNKYLVEYACVENINGLKAILSEKTLTKTP